jgi:hypothetical protein
VRNINVDIKHDSSRLLVSGAAKLLLVILWVIKREQLLVKKSFIENRSKRDSQPVEYIWPQMNDIDSHSLMFTNPSHSQYIKGTSLGEKEIIVQTSYKYPTVPDPSKEPSKLF